MAAMPLLSTRTWRLQYGGEPYMSPELPSIIHTSHGNCSPSRRRLALSTRWLGDDACWDPRPGTDPIVTQEHVSLEPGALARDDKAFPLVWQAR